MIPILYESTEENFNTNGIGLLVDAISCEVSEERNGVFELTLNYPQEGHLAKYLAEDCIIKAKPNDTDEDQLFRIYKSGKPLNGNITWYAEHISYECNGYPIPKVKITGKNAQEAIAQLLSDSVIENKFTVYSDITDRKSTQIDDVVSVRKALGGVEGSILDVWGGEYRFNNYRIELHKARGADNGVEIRYGKNIIDAKQEKNIADVVTAIFPYAYYTPEKAEGQDEDPEEIFVSLPEKIITTPNADKYARIRCLPVDFSDDFEDGKVITEAMLRSVAAKYAKSGIDKPNINITATFANLWQTKEYAAIKALEKVGLCDIVTIVIERLGISVKAKVIKYKYNVLKERFNSVEIGEVRTNLTREITKEKAETEKTIIKTATRADIIKKQIEKTILDVTAAITGNSGGHVLLHPAENPQEIFIMDTDDTATAKNVWRWNLAGLGHSSDGIGGPFTTAITANGKIVADFITAGKLIGSIIAAGTIKAEALDVEYRQAVKKYADDGDAAVLEKVTSKFEVTAEAISAEVSRATKIEGELRASIKVNADNITSCVTKNGIGSYITQYYNNVIVAFNNNSKYVQLGAGQIAIYDAAITDSKKRSVFDESGNHFWRDGYYVGRIGTNQWASNHAHKGLVFDLEYTGKYMAWAQEETEGASEYTTILCYSRANSIYNTAGLHLGCSMYGHNHIMDGTDLRNTLANGYATFTGTLPVVLSIEDAGNGNVVWNYGNITIQNGLITSVPT